MPVCWRCLRWGWRDNRQRRRRCRSNHSRTAVWRENDNDVDIHREKPSSPNRNSSAEDINFLREVACISTPKRSDSKLYGLCILGPVTIKATVGTAGKTGVTGYCLQPPSAAHFYQARITKNYTIKHYRVDYYEYGVKKRTFIRTCMSRYLKLHILSASHKFAYRRESS